MSVFGLEQSILPAPSMLQKLSPRKGVAASITEVGVNRHEAAARVAANKAPPRGTIHSIRQTLALHPRDGCIQWYWKAFWSAS